MKRTFRSNRTPNPHSVRIGNGPAGFPSATNNVKEGDMKLRDYQSKAVESVLEAVRFGRKPVLVLPTGGGKTACAVSIIQRFGGRSLVLAHRTELVQQAAGHLRNAGLAVGIIQAGYPRFPGIATQVASIQTLRRRENPPADIVILDECHHVLADTFRSVIESYPAAGLVGLTATPWHGSGRGLGDIFNEIIVGAQPDELVALKYLVEPRVYAPPAPSLRGVGTRAGEYVTSDLAERYDRPKLVADVVETWRKYAAGRTSLVFAVNVLHSKHIAEQFCAAGIRAEHVDGDTHPAERAATLARLATGETTVISNCGLFTEGFDLPRIKCVVLARATKSLSLYRQMVGRAMRPVKEGESAIVLDHGSNIHVHGRVTQRIEYSLSDGPVVKADSAATGLRTCMQCYRLCLASRRQCPECGADLTRQVELPEHEAGELEAVDRDAAIEAQEQTFNELLAQAREFGHKPGWAFHRFKERFGHMPTTLTVDGDYVFINPAKTSEAMKQSMFEKWIAEGQQKGFKPGYAAVRFKQVFGTWPRRVKKEVA
jgi:DNA repair protein RadD